MENKVTGTTMEENDKAPDIAKPAGLPFFPNPRRKNCTKAIVERSILKDRSVVSVDIQRAAEDKLVEKAKYDETSCVMPDSPRSTFLMVFSPDGKKVASTHGNHNIYVTDATTGKHIQTLSGHPRTPWCIAFHPSSNQILASGCLGGQVRVWDLQGGSEVWTAESQTVIASLAFHPMDRLLVIATFNELHFWDWSQPEPFAKCSTKTEREKVRYVTFDRLGNKIITGIANPLPVQSMWDRTGPFFTEASTTTAANADTTTSAPTTTVCSVNVRAFTTAAATTSSDLQSTRRTFNTLAVMSGSTPSAREQSMAYCYRHLMNQYNQLVRRYFNLSRSRVISTIDRGTDPMELFDTLPSIFRNADDVESTSSGSGSEATTPVSLPAVTSFRESSRLLRSSRRFSPFFGTARSESTTSTYSINRGVVSPRENVRDSQTSRGPSPPDRNEEDPPTRSSVDSGPYCTRMMRALLRELVETSRQEGNETNSASEETAETNTSNPPTPRTLQLRPRLIQEPGYRVRTFTRLSSPLNRVNSRPDGLFVLSRHSNSPFQPRVPLRMEGPPVTVPPTSTPAIPSTASSFIPARRAPANNNNNNSNNTPTNRNLDYVQHKSRLKCILSTALRRPTSQPLLAQGPTGTSSTSRLARRLGRRRPNPHNCYILRRTSNLNLINPRYSPLGPSIQPILNLWRDISLLLNNLLQLQVPSMRYQLPTLHAFQNQLQIVREMNLNLEGRPSDTRSASTSGEDVDETLQLFNADFQIIANNMAEEMTMNSGIQAPQPGPSSAPDNYFPPDQMNQLRGIILNIVYRRFFENQRINDEANETRFPAMETQDYSSPPQTLAQLLSSAASANLNRITENLETLRQRLRDPFVNPLRQYLENNTSHDDDSLGRRLSDNESEETRNLNILRRYPRTTDDSTNSRSTGNRPSPVRRPAAAYDSIQASLFSMPLRESLRNMLVDRSEETEPLNTATPVHEDEQQSARYTTTEENNDQQQIAQPAVEIRMNTSAPENNETAMDSETPQNSSIANAPKVASSSVVSRYSLKRKKPNPKKGPQQKMPRPSDDSLAILENEFIRMLNDSSIEPEAAELVPFPLTLDENETIEEIATEARNSGLAIRLEWTPAIINSYRSSLSAVRLHILITRLISELLSYFEGDSRALNHFTLSDRLEGLNLANQTIHGLRQLIDRRDNQLPQRDDDKKKDKTKTKLPIQDNQVGSSTPNSIYLPRSKKYRAYMQSQLPHSRDTSISSDWPLRFALLCNKRQRTGEAAQQPTPPENENPSDNMSYSNRLIFNQRTNPYLNRNLPDTPASADSPNMTENRSQRCPLHGSSRLLIFCSCPTTTTTESCTGSTTPTNLLPNRRCQYHGGQQAPPNSNTPPRRIVLPAFPIHRLAMERPNTTTANSNSNSASSPFRSPLADVLRRMETRRRTQSVVTPLQYREFVTEFMNPLLESDNDSQNPPDEAETPPPPPPSSRFPPSPRFDFLLRNNRRLNSDAHALRDLSRPYPNDIPYVQEDESPRDYSRESPREIPQEGSRDGLNDSNGSNSRSYSPPVDRVSRWRWYRPRFLHPRYPGPNPFDENEGELFNAAYITSNSGGLYTLDPVVITTEPPLTPHHRIQAWNFSQHEIPDISKRDMNVVVGECKIHNDASVDVSADGKLLVTLLPSGRHAVTTMLGVYSLEWATLGQLLYKTGFDQNAVSVSLSPTARHLLVGLASRPLAIRDRERPHIAHIFRLGGAHTMPPDSWHSGRGVLDLVRAFEQPRDMSLTSLNCIRWAPGPGYGFVYGTNTGQLKILR